MRRHPLAAPLTEEEIARAQETFPIRRIKPARKRNQLAYSFRSQAGFGIAAVVAKAAASVPDPEPPAEPEEPEAEET